MTERALLMTDLVESTRLVETLGQVRAPSRLAGRDDSGRHGTAGSPRSAGRAGAGAEAASVEVPWDAGAELGVAGAHRARARRPAARVIVRIAFAFGRRLLHSLGGASPKGLR